MRRSRLAPLLATPLLALAAAGCGDDADTAGETVAAGETVVTAPATAGATDPSTIPGSAAAADVPEALQFEAPLVGGGTIDFREYAGTTVALWFWAPT